jgi:hypothetical protein
MVQGKWPFPPPGGRLHFLHFLRHARLGSMGGSSTLEELLPCPRARGTGRSGPPFSLDPHFYPHSQREPQVGFRLGLDQLPVRRTPAIRLGHFPALPCPNPVMPHCAPPAVHHSSLTAPWSICPARRPSLPSAAFRLQSQTQTSRCDIGRAGAEFVVDKSSEAVERTPSTPPSMP